MQGLSAQTGLAEDSSPLLSAAIDQVTPPHMAVALFVVCTPIFAGGSISL